MQKCKIVVRNYNKKSGGTFTKLSISGKYINDVLADETKQYLVKFTSKSVAKAPTSEGIYEVAYNDGEAWIDSRPEMAEKCIYRITAQKVKFFSNLRPRKEKVEEVSKEDVPF